MEDRLTRKNDPESRLPSGDKARLLLCGISGTPGATCIFATVPTPASGAEIDHVVARQASTRQNFAGQENQHAFTTSVIRSYCRQYRSEMGGASGKSSSGNSYGKLIRATSYWD